MALRSLWIALVGAYGASAHPLRRLTVPSALTSVACPTADSPLARVTAPALTSLCPANCDFGGACVYFPSGSEGLCETNTEVSCVRGDACAFQCFPVTGDDSEGWFFTLYDTADVLEQTSSSNYFTQVNFPTFRTSPLNASIVSQWIGSYEFQPQQLSLFIAGNEPANNIQLNDDGMNKDVLPLPPGSIVPFSLPPTFFEDVQGYRLLRLENIKFPAVTNVTSEFTFPVLSTLFLRNTMLTSFPLANASFPQIDNLDLSANFFTEIVPSTVPELVVFLNFSWNAISRVDKDAFSTNSNLGSLDLTFNFVKSFANGTLPPGIQELFLGQNLLTEIPGDIAGMENLTKLFLDGNDIKEIPDNAIPPDLVELLGLENCSLSAVPKVLGSMPVLKQLWLGRNDLSRNPDFSLLPKKLEQLYLGGAQLEKLPVELKNLTKLQILDLENNPKALADLSSIPPQLMTLYLTNNELEVLPPDLKDLGVTSLMLDGNPLSKITPGSLPANVAELTIQNATFRVLPNGTFPVTLNDITVSHSALEEVPGDLFSLSVLQNLDLIGCRLSAFEVGDAMRPIEGLRLSYNRIASFSGDFPTLSRLFLRNNLLTTFEHVEAPAMEWLDLSGNNLTTFPAAIFEMPSLMLLNLTGNPIRNFKPSSGQLTFLQRVEWLILDQTMFASDCEPSASVSLNQYNVCLLPEAVKKVAASKSWKWLVPMNLALAILLAILIYAFWRRRKLQKQRANDLAADRAILEKQQQEQAGISIWADAALLRDRLDEDLIKRERLLGSGMFGEVWLATYKNDKVALKQLKQNGSHGVVDPTAISDFVGEIKLLQSLSHPSVVQFIGVTWTKESDIAMVTEFMDGGDMRSYLDLHPKIYAGWTTQMVRIALQITEAIVYLHSLDPIVIHRDLKSRNVLLDTAMHAKLSDLGISRYKIDDDTMTAGVGTVRWVAPEVLAGQRYDESVDIYSLGVICSEIDTHKVPFEGLADDSGELLSDSAIAGMIVTGALEVGVSKSCPSEIRSLVERCTAFDASMRPRAFDVAYELRLMLEGSSASTTTSDYTNPTSSSNHGIFRSPTSSV